MTASFKPRFRLNSVVQLRWASWDDEHVVFDIASGQTHLLDPLRAYVLHSMDNCAVSVEDLWVGMVDSSDAVEATATKRTMDAILSEFLALGLVEMALE